MPLLTGELYWGTSSRGRESVVDKLNVDLIANLPLLTCVKDIHSFLRYLVSARDLLRILVRFLSLYLHS